MTDSEIHDCMTLLCALSERPRCGAGRMVALVALSMAVGALIGGLLW